MKRLIFFLAIGFIYSSCNSIDSKSIIQSITNQKDLEDLRIEFIRDPYAIYPYVILSRIKMDSMQYESVKASIKFNCSKFFVHPDFLFESFEISYGNIHSCSSDDIPEWFNPNPSLIDFYSSYNYDKKQVVECGEDSTDLFLMQYYKGYCYIIVESFPSVD